MDILNSGSFVPLDNREKIEQLIFTAKTLATEVSRTEGFQSSGPTNQQLGLEMWKGAEYVCRAHEEANIRNLFLSKFLERLREIERQSVVQSRTSQTQAVNPPATRSPDPVRTQIDNPITAPLVAPIQMQVASSPLTPTEPVHATVPPSSPAMVPGLPQGGRDEYLGVVSPDNERPSYADECKPEFEREFEAMNDGTDTEDVTSTPAEEEANENAPKEQAASEPSQPAELVVTAAGNADVSEAGLTVEPLSEESDTTESPIPDTAAGIDAIVLSEKEPYNFDSCTVTSVIQLLPENGGIRKRIFSIRSHDFAPQINISDVSSGDVNEGIKQCLETALAQYQTNLPVLAAEKIKKQKPASKKRTSKAADKGTKANSVSDTKASACSTNPPAAQTSEASQDQRNLFAS